MNQEVVTRKNGYHGQHFRATRGIIQGGIALPTPFNVGVDSVVCHWILLKMEDKAVIQDGLGHSVGWSLGFSHSYDGIMGSRDLEWLQGALNFLIGLFWSIRLEENIAKSNKMTCQLGAIKSGMSE